MTELEKLKEHTCKSFGGNNCTLHQCMFGCILDKAKKEAIEKEIKDKK